MDEQHDTDQPDDDEPGAASAGNARLHVKGRHVARTQSVKYHNEDLPGYPQTIKMFRDYMLPRWYLYITTLDDPWDLHHPDHVKFAQQLWTSYLQVKHKLALRNEPVFAIVSEDSYLIDDIDRGIVRSNSVFVNGGERLPKRLFLLLRTSLPSIRS